MTRIQVLDPVTIDKIAAGEVIERPASVVKELVENAVDAGATSVTVDIKEGGISFMRIADNGCGIGKEDVRAAFLRHSTSKIRSAEDLSGIRSLGFRGEALSSIAAVSQVELLTKRAEEVSGSRYRIAGGKEEGLEEAGVPDGTTFLIRQLFYNTPARKKFLRTAMTEASHVGELLTRLALSHPEISFRFINSGQIKLHTAGNGNLKDVIYHVYGRETASNLLKADYEKNGIRITGFLGKPVISRGNRNFENFFVDGRTIKSNTISKAVEDAYKDFSMQHKYPFVALHLSLAGGHVDVNVHPAKLEVRFDNQQEVYNAVYEAVSTGLHEEELIPHVTLDGIPQAVPGRTGAGKARAGRNPAGAGQEDAGQRKAMPGRTDAGQSPAGQEDPGRTGAGQTQPGRTGAGQTQPGRTDAGQMPAGQRKAVPGQAGAGRPPSPQKKDLDYYMAEMKKRVYACHGQNSSAEVTGKTSVFQPEIQTDRIREAVSYAAVPKASAQNQNAGKAEEKPVQQLSLFGEKLLKPESRALHKIVGQVFDTYWIVEYQADLYIIDQHAAHERVLYERTLRGMKTRDFTSQMISPPIILNLSMQEAGLLKTYMDQFTRIGFEIEEFGQDSYAVRAVPDNLFSIAKKELLMEMLDGLSDEISRNAPSDLIDEKIASLSCKAAVKGNMRLTAAEADALIGELLTLENPYHCPHGRPTIIAMSKRELEKKFKRIV